MKSKKQRQENLENLIKAIDNDSICQILEPCEEWGGAKVIITSDEEKIVYPNIDYDFHSSSFGDLYVLTKHADILSGLFYYVKDNVLEKRDNYIYAFMALLSIDFIRQNGDGDVISLLEHVILNIRHYFEYFDWESGMGKSDTVFNLMRYYLSRAISSRDIRFML